MGKLKLVNGKVEDYTIVLATKELSHLGQLTGVTNITSVENLNAANEFSFTVHKNDLNSNYTSDIKEYRDYIWRNLNDLRLIWVKELDEYFQIQTPLNDSRESVTKNIVCKSLCESELSQVALNTIEINTEGDILRKDYVATTFYNAENKKASLLHRVLEKAPAYTIGHVDESLKDVQRTFSIDGTTIYDFLVGECAKQVNCLFIFDSAKRTVSAYDLYESYCNECGKRGDFDTCPNCGSSNLSHYGYGEDTTILVDKNNLTDSISFETNVDSIKNCFKLEAGDEIMTAVVRSLLQSGSDYLTYFPDWQREQMPKELQDKLKEYDDKYANYKSDYQDFLGKLYAKMDEKTYLEYTKFPEIEKFEITARTEADKITNESMTDVALTSINENTLSSSVNNAVKNYAKVMIMTGYVKIEIDPDTETIFTYDGESDGYHYGTWTGKFKITNYSDSEDVAYTGLLTIRISDNYEDFVKQRALKEIKGSDSDDGSVYNVLAIDDLGRFKEAIKEYNLSSLQSFYDAIDGALCVLQQEEMTNTEIYKSYYDKLCACEEQKNCIGEQITILEKEIEDYSSKIEKIQSELNIETHLGDLYPIFCTYKREDKYSNSNYISDGLDNSQLLESANEFIEVATQELYNSCEKQHSISSNLFNLLAIKEFEPIVKYFKVGNWIRIKVDGALYKLRLISYTINYDDLNTINVTFSNVTKVFNPKVQRDSLMSSVQSMATSYGTVSRQAESGKDASDELNSWYNEGLNGALIQIKNNDKEEVTYGKHGILCRTYDDITESFSDKQLRLTHNILAFTDNNWKTVKTALGEHQYYKYIDGKKVSDVGYGLSAEFVNAGFVYGSQIVGGEIYSDNYSSTGKTGSYIDLRNGEFSFGGDGLYYRNGKFVISDTVIGDTLETININAENLHVQAANIEGDFHGKNIYGGYVLIGDKENEEGAYAEITEDGILNCKGANFTGNIIGGNITGVDIVGSTFTATSTVVRTAQNYNEDDLIRAQQIANRAQACTADDIEKYDLNGDGMINARDLLAINKLLNGYTESYSYDRFVQINPPDSTCLIKTPGVAIGISSIFSKIINAETTYLNTVYAVDNEGEGQIGITGKYAVGDKTINVIHGIIVGIS